MADKPEKQAALTVQQRAGALAAEAQSVLRYGTILIALLAFIFLVARPALRFLASGPAPRATAPGPAASLHRPPAPELQELTPEQQAAEQRRLRSQTVFEQVSENVKRDPAQSTRLLESWIRSE